MACTTSIADVVWGLMNHYTMYMLPKYEENNELKKEAVEEIAKKQVSEVLEEILK